MKALMIMTTILMALSQGCSKSTTDDKQFQDHHDRQDQQDHDMYYKDLKIPENIHSTRQGDV